MATSSTKPPEASNQSSNNHRASPPRQSSSTDGGLPPLPPERDSRIKRPLNSRRTGGPSSSEGRAKSSLNAIKHGGYVTARSSALEYQQILSDLISRINPMGKVEEGLVESLAIELLRLSMLGKLEVERLQSAVNSEVGALALAQALEYPWAATHLDELRNPPRLSTLRARVAKHLRAQHASLLAQCAHSPSDAEHQAIEALQLAIEDLTSRTQVGDVSEDGASEPAYFDELDRHMRALASSHDLLNSGMALPADLQPLVDYWLLRNYYRIEATRRELQVAQMVLVLTNDGVRRSRSQAMRQLDDCMHLLELLQGAPLDVGTTSRGRLSLQRNMNRLAR